MRLGDWLLIILHKLCSPENGCVHLKMIKLSGVSWQVMALKPVLNPVQVTHMTWVLGTLMGKCVRMRMPLAELIFLQFSSWLLFHPYNSLLSP